MSTRKAVPIGRIPILGGKRAVKFGPAVIILTVFFLMASRSVAQPLPSPETDAVPIFAKLDKSAECSISLQRMPGRIAADQKRIWLFPLTAAKGHGWKPALAVLGITAGLVALDPTDTRFFQRASYQQDPAVHRINQVLSGTNTSLLMAAVPVTFYIAGLVRKDSYASETALLAGEAALNSVIVTVALKDIGRRLRPYDVAPNGNLSATWFRNPDRSPGGFGSFPSGHTAGAFSVATVFAERYRTHRWAPWVAYGLAGVVGLSRLNLQAHFPSDIFFGAALGYSVSHFAVLRR
jgi:membrane-associated phospholipid phosphatase